jgi:hypothetical protein
MCRAGHVSSAPYVDGSGLARGFDFLHVAGRSCHVSGLGMRHRTRPLAMMLSAGWVPVKIPRSKRLAQSGLSLSLGCRLAIIGVTLCG